MNFQSKWLGLFVAIPLMIGLVSLSGWWIDHDKLALVIPGYAGMTFNTTFGFILLSVGLGITLLLPNAIRRVRIVRFSMAIFLIVFASLTLLQNIFSVSMGLDNLFFNSVPYYPENPYPGRMSPQTLIAFIFSGIGLLLLAGDSVRAPMMINICIFIVKLLGLYGIMIAVLFPVKPAGLAYLSSMSLFTALAFLSASLALRGLFQRCDKHTESERQSFFPAIRLMFRLSYPKKFLLIGLIFILPLTVTTWYAFSSSNADLNTLQKEIEGLKIGGELMTLFAMTQRQRGMMNAFLNDGETFKRALPKQKYLIDEYIRRIGKASQALQSFPRKQWRDIEYTWQRVRDKKDIHDAASSWKEYTILIEMMTNFIHQIGKNSTLLYDLDPISNDLSSVVFIDMPHLFETVGVLRGRGAGFLASDVYADDEYRLEMIALDGKMNVWFDTMIQSLRTIVSLDPIRFEVLAKNIEDDFLPAMQKLDHVVDDMNTKRINPMRAEAFFAVATRALNAGFSLHVNASESLQSTLDIRINELMQMRYILASVVMIALLLILYLFAAFYKSVMLTIAALHEKAQQMHQGDFTSALTIDNQDELAHVVDSFNLVAEELVHAVDEAKEATVAKSRFLATMSHEIRTPLNGVLGLTELVLDSNLTPQQREQLQTVHASGETLLTILNDILDFSKMEAEQLTLNPAPFSPNELIEHVVKLYAQNAHVKGINMMGGAIADLDCYLIGDSDRLQQMLMNLVSNAVKFTDEGDVSIRVSSLGATMKKIWLRFEVCDSGIGISPENQKKLFQDFSQVSDSHTRKYGGTGLGLAITMRLLGLMGGHIQVKSEEGKGSTFFFDIELQKGKRLPDAAILYRQEFKQWRILIVDHESDARSMLCDLLLGWGMAVDLVDSKDATLQMLMASSSPYHMVILDKMMVDVDALDVAHAIKQEDELSNVKIIMQCSYDEVRSEYKNEKECVDAFLRKPLYASTLYKQILRVMGHLSNDHTAELTQDEYVPEREERILLAEDVIVNQQVAVGMLRKLGFVHVDIANNGLEAVEMFGKEEYAMIFMDIQMPEMDGHTAAGKIRELMQGTDQKVHVPIVALTANAFGDDHSDSLGAGMNDHITKPLTGAKLAEVMNHWLPNVHADEVDVAIETEVNAVNEVEASASGINESTLRQLHQDMGGMSIAPIIDSYVDGLDSHCAAMRAAIDQEDGDALRRAAHKLKGGSRSMGADLLGEIAGKLEDVGAEGEFVTAKVMLAALHQELEVVQKDLGESWLDEVR